MKVGPNFRGTDTRSNKSQTARNSNNYKLPIKKAFS